ncbi:MAG: peptidoglycan DD-metalloendopeptidase family protein [Christensenellales bacterium]
MSEKLSFWKKVKLFVRRNSYALLVSGCALVLVVALVITAVVKNNHLQANKDIDTSMNETIVDNGGQVQASSDDVFSIIVPVKNYTSIVDFTNNTAVYYEAVKHWTTHEAIDYITVGNEEVMAVANGVVETVGYSSLEGNYVVIKHNEKYKSVYKSLSSDVVVKEGDAVTSGQVIGVTSDSAGTESKLGNHLHFELLDNEEPINPMDLLQDK